MKHNWTKESLIDFEAFLAEEFKQGKINCPLHLCGGNEEPLLAIFDHVEEWDYVLSSHRSHYHYLLKGGDKQKLLDEIYGKPTGLNGGNARSMNILDPSINFYSSAIVAGICSITAGLGLSIRKKFAGSQVHPRVWCFVGDGAEDSGHFIEAVRFANCRNLPVNFVIEDNDLSIETTKAQRWSNYKPIQGSNILRYEYKRAYPHVGIGQWVGF